MNNVHVKYTQNWSLKLEEIIFEDLSLNCNFVSFNLKNATFKALILDQQLLTPIFNFPTIKLCLYFFLQAEQAHSASLGRRQTALQSTQLYYFALPEAFKVELLSF